MIILSERTPNPEAMKFLPQARLTDGPALAFGPDAKGSPLASRLFALPGVRRVLIAADFLTVTRAPDGPPWSDLRYAVLAAIAEHLDSGEPAVAAGQTGAAPQPSGDTLEDEIRDVLGRYVRPGVAADGGDILFDRFDAGTGVLWIRMQGACGGCPSARLTLKANVERIVRRFVPEVLEVSEAVSDAAGPPPPSRLKAWVSSFKGGAGPRPRTVFTRSRADSAGG